MRPKFAVLLDGGFVVTRLRNRLRRFPATADIRELCAAIESAPQVEGLELLRHYWYDAPPAQFRIRHPLDGEVLHLGSTPRFVESHALHQALELSPNVAVRMGELAFRGWQLRPRALEELGRESRPLRASDLKPQLEQKGVDLRIGLDIARLALRSLVDALVVVSGDSDLIPAFKFARREGVRVLLAPLDASVRRELRAHADEVLSQPSASG